MKRLVVIGGGAAGFFCAVNAARLNPALEVIILEKNILLLSKVKVSGGGRCNVTHDAESVDELLDAYPRGRTFMRKTLYQFSNKDTEKWFNERGVKLKVEKDGRMFPDTNDSQTIIDCLMQEAEKYGVKIITQTNISSIHFPEDYFTISGYQQKTIFQINCDYLAIATGGSPKVEGYDWLKSLGVEVENPVPSLFTFNIKENSLHALMGLSVSNAIIKIPSLKIQEQGAMLITHWGLSGPAVLKLSSRAAIELQQMKYDFNIVVNWFGDLHESAMLEQLKIIKLQNLSSKIGSKNQFGFSSRLWEYLLKRSCIDPEKKWSEISGQEINHFSRTLSSDQYIVSGKTTFKEEFVTAGGVKTNDINPQSMEHKKIKGLYFMGEVINVDGITGGYNFQNAWTSGWIAANAIAKNE